MKVTEKEPLIKLTITIVVLVQVRLESGSWEFIF